MSGQDPAAHDIVIIDSLSLSATIGKDWWGRVRPQPLFVTLHLHLQPGYLDKAAAADDVGESIHYGHLTKSIMGLVDGRDAQVFDGPRNLARAVAKAAFALTGAIAAQRAVVAIKSEKLIPLAGEFTMEISTSYTEEVIEGTEDIRVTIKDLALSIIIGVNPPEREAKQRVITTVIIHGRPGHGEPIDYPSLVARIANVIPPA